MSKTKNDGLDQNGTEAFKQQQFGPAGVEGLLTCYLKILRYLARSEINIRYHQNLITSGGIVTHIPTKLHQCLLLRSIGVFNVL